MQKAESEIQYEEKLVLPQKTPEPVGKTAVLDSVIHVCVYVFKAQKNN